MTATSDTAPAPDSLDKIANDLFGPTAILRSLVIFNLLFAVQTVLDVTYLWGGVTLPDELTYATYAHRGAYPLIFTALLAAGFILAATHAGTTRPTRFVRMLILVWTAQNIMLVISSILRLDLYVQIYSLTWWRVAAFIWMLLVATGLVLIVTRMVLEKSNRWLVLANVSALVFTLYVCAFVNFPSVIAFYNVDHSHELSGKGISLDLEYLVQLGPEAQPAIDRYTRARQQSPKVQSWCAPGALSNGALVCNAMRVRRDALAATLRAELSSWRTWSVRGWRLQRDLAREADEAGATRRETSPDAP